MSTTTSNARSVVVTALAALSRGDEREFARHRAAHYVEHGLGAPDGGHSFPLPAAFRFELARTIADDEYVVTHGVHHGPVPLVGIDLWRVDGGRIVEHWDCVVPEVAPTASGRSQVDGPTGIDHPEQTEATRALIDTFVDDVIVPGRWEEFPRYFDGDTFAQHNPRVRDGLGNLLEDFARFAEEGTSLVITHRHQTVAEGEFAFTRSDGTIAGRPALFFDLWRIADGKIAEHWDTYRERPGTTGAHR